MKIRFLICLLCTALAGTLDAAPGWDAWGIHHQSSELLDREDFQGLETLAAKLKSNGYDIQQEQPELGAFYGGTKLADDAPATAWPDRLNVIERWRAAFPKSLSAKIAEIYWYLDYPPGAFVPPQPPGVLPEPGNMPAPINCDQKAEELLKAAPSASVDDPEYYVCWLKLCRFERLGPDEMWSHFKQGTAMAPEYMSIYLAACDYLLPINRGAKGEQERDIKQWADQWPGPKGDAAYAYLLMDIASQYTLNFLKKMPGLDYGRARQGLQERLAGNDPARWRDENILAFLAATEGDKATTKSAFLAIEGSADMDIFRSARDYQKWRNTSGATAEYDAATALERAGNLKDAEARLLSFTSDPGTYLPLEYFYERQGMLDKLEAMNVVYKNMTVKQMMDLDPGYSPAEVLGETISVFAMMGEWDKAQVAAQRFVQLRPQNLIGKNVTLLCAIHAGDPVKTVNAVLDILRTPIDPTHTIYRHAQAVLSGESTWEDVSKQMKNNNPYLGQATTAIVLFYMARGQDDEAKKIIDEQLPWCAENSGKAVLESLLYGSLSRSLKPVTLLPSGGPAPGAPVTGGTATTTGT